MHVATTLKDVEQCYELMLKSLQLFVRQGIEARKASERAEALSSHKVCSRGLQDVLWHVRSDMFYLFRQPPVPLVLDCCSL